MAVGLQAVSLIRRTFWGETVTKPQHAGRHNSDKHIVVAHTLSDRVLAAGTLRMERPDIGYVNEVVTAPEYRCHGFATAVMERIEDIAGQLGAKSLHLLAIPEVQPFYEQLGYEQAGAPHNLVKAIQAA